MGLPTRVTTPGGSPLFSSIEANSTAVVTLDSDAIGALNVYEGSSNGTWTLPGASGAGDGGYVWIQNDTAFRLTVSRAGSDNIERQGSSLTKLVLDAGAWGCFTSDGTSVWHYSGTDRRVTLSSAGSGSYFVRECNGGFAIIRGYIPLAAVTALGASTTGTIDTGFNFPPNALMIAAGLSNPEAATTLTSLLIQLKVGVADFATIPNAAVGANDGVSSAPSYIASDDITVDFTGNANLNTCTGLGSGVLVHFMYMKPPLTA